MLGGFRYDYRLYRLRYRLRWFWNFAIESEGSTDILNGADSSGGSADSLNEDVPTTFGNMASIRQAS